jgi:putative sigma-54 modulation protein
MLVAVRETGIGLSPAGRAYAIDRVEHALATVRDHVRKVMVYLTDLNGPRGGADKLCRVAVTLDTGRPVVVVTSGESVTGVVDGAADKAGEVVHEELHRRSDRRRSNRVVRALKELKRLFGRKGNQS